MSSIAFKELAFWSDVLSANGLKPWWETIRSYLVVTMYGAAFFLIYDVQPEDAIHCRPPANLSNTLSGDDTVYVNTFCFGQLEVLHANVGSISMAACLVIQLLYSWWLMIPRVSKTFSKVRRADKKLEKVNLAAEDLKLKARQICFHPDVPEDSIKSEDASVIVHVCADLWNPRSEHSFNIRTIYFIRNLLVLVPLALSIAVCMILIISPKSSFTCEVDIATYSEMECTHNLSIRTFPFLVTFAACQVALVILSFLTLIAHFCNRGKFNIARDDKIKDWDQFIDKEYDNIFVKRFSKHAISLSRKTKGILRLTDVIPVKEFKNRLQSEFANSFRVFLRDLNGKVFLEGLDDYRKVRKLGLQVFAGNRFKEFVDAHYKLFSDICDAEAPDNTQIAKKVSPNSVIDPCRCRYLFAVYSEDNLKYKVENSLFYYMATSPEKTDKQKAQLLGHFLGNLPPKLTEYGADQANTSLISEYGGVIPQPIKNVLDRYDVEDPTSVVTVF